MNKMHNYEPYAIEEGYHVLIAEYHHSLCGIEDYFQQADRKLILKLVDDTSCKLLRVTTAKDAEDREKCLNRKSYDRPQIAEQTCCLSKFH